MKTFCIAGKNQIAIDGVQLLLDANIEKRQIVACLNKTDSGVNGWQPSFYNFCKRNNINLVDLKELYEIEDLVFFSLEFDQILKTQHFKTNDLFNIHFSLLPKYKGMFTSVMPLLNGENVSGVTLHKIDKGIDTGDIISQVEFPIDIKDRSIELYFLYLSYAKKLLENNITSIINGTYTTSSQKTYHSSYFSKKAIDFKNIVFDFNKTAFEIHNQIRAFSFRPYQLCMINDKKISHSLIKPTKSTNKPGTIENIDNYSFKLSSIDYNLIVFYDCLDEILNKAKENDLDFIVDKHSKGYFLNDKNEKGWDALIVATYNENKEVFDFLLETNCDINSCNVNGTSVLMYAMTAACKSNNLYFLKRLLAYGAKIEHKDFKGKDVIEYCAHLDNILVYNFLSKYNENPIS